MAYRILYDDKLLYDPYTDDVVWDVTLSSNLNSGMLLSFLDFTMPSTHELANVIKEKSGVITVYSGEFKLFEGYIENISSDMYSSKTVSCCSAINYLNDTIVRPYSTSPGEEALTAPSEIDKLFKWYIDQHNSRVMNAKQQFNVGINQGLFLKQSGRVYRQSAQLPTTADEISEKLLSLGGYLFLRFENGLKILDLYADAHETNSQLIDFGMNLIDFTQLVETNEQYTAIRPTGGTPEKENDTDPEPKQVTLESLVNGATSYDSDMMKRGDVVYSISGVQRYGYREFSWDESETLDPTDLLRKAIPELRKVLYPALTITIKAIDLSLYLPGYKSLICGQVARIRSIPHKIDEYLMLNSIDLDLQNPDNSTYTFGVTYDTFTGQQSKFIKSLNSSINSQLDKVDAISKEAKDAADKAQNASEAAKKSIISVTDQFYQSTSATELSGGEWKETNTWEQGKFTWRRSLNVYGDYTQEYVPSEKGICISGNTGPEGPPGFDGRGIKSYSVAYQLSDSGTTTPTGSWSSTPLVATDDQPYLWVRNTILYTDETTEKFYSITPKGSKGQQGDPGSQGIPGPEGPDGMSSYLHIAYANSSNGDTGFSTTDSTNKLYIGQYTDFTADDSTDPTKYAWTKIKGDNGRGIRQHTVGYKLSNNGTVPPDGPWGASPIPATDAQPYLWVQNTIVYTDDTTEKFYSVSPKGSKGAQGDPGEEGIEGPPGPNGETSYLHIAYANSADGKTGFSTTDSTNKLYIGQYTDFIELDSTDPTKYSWTKIKGDNGQSVTITNTTISYQASYSGTVTPTTWLPTIPDVPNGSYLWTRTIVDYSDGKRTVSYSVAYNGTDGSDGKDGKMLYATSNTPGATKDKVATLTSGILNFVVGATVSVTFDEANSANAPTLNVEGTGAKPIMTSGVAYAYWAAGATVVFVYSGSHWMTASTPVYAPTSTIGNPVGGNVFTDDSSINIRNGSSSIASFNKNTIELGKENQDARISFCGDKGFVEYRIPEDGDRRRFKISSDDDISLEGGHYSSVRSEFTSEQNIWYGASVSANTKAGNDIKNPSVNLSATVNGYGNVDISKSTFMRITPGQAIQAAVNSGIEATIPTIRHIPLEDVTTNPSYPGLIHGSGDKNNYFRTPVQGLIPYSSASTGVGSIGTATWPFYHMYAMNIHPGGATITGDSNWIYTKGVAAIRMCTQQNSIYPVYGARLIYSNASGTNTTFGVTEHFGNFAQVQITFRTNDGEYASAEIYSPNGKTINLGTGIIKGAAGAGWYKSKQFLLSGTTATYVGYAGESAIGPGSGGTNFMNSIYVCYVVGYR